MKTISSSGILKTIYLNDSYLLLFGNTVTSTLLEEIQ